MKVREEIVEQTITADSITLDVDSTIDFGDYEMRVDEQTTEISDIRKTNPILKNILGGSTGNVQGSGETFSVPAEGGLDKLTRDITPNELANIDDYRGERQSTNIEFSMWLLIVVIIVVVIGKFLFDRNEVNTKITREGGMRQKYKELIEGLISSSDGRLQVLKETSDSVILGYRIGGSVLSFALIQTFQELTVQWKMESSMYGKHKYEWSFPEYKDQDEIGERITNDLNKYMDNVSNSSPFS